ncbi:HK97-gp10 family putative phage morphogenesis protein [Cupriavidus sp. RAF12]|uniref:HK97-gp10 family putative phage morphogenesis protein n=1 Tax=Cupriavidus sp. RAF12 TaxID=3233050 RepID=UPI003F919561
MVAKLSIQNPGALTDAIDALEKLASESVLRQATVAGARVIFYEVKLRVPVGAISYERKGTKHYPGFLRDHILIAYEDENSVEGLRASYIVTWGKEAFYGRFIEHGTSKMGAQAFLRPAYDATKNAAAEAFGEVIDRKVKELTSGK